MIGGNTRVSFLFSSNELDLSPISTRSRRNDTIATSAGFHLIFILQRFATLEQAQNLIYDGIGGS